MNKFIIILNSVKNSSFENGSDDPGQCPETVLKEYWVNVRE